MRRSSLPILLTLGSIISGVSCLAVPNESTLDRRSSADLTAKTRLSVDQSFYSHDTPGKYFHEAEFSNHYDSRFGGLPLKYHDRKAALSALMQSYLQTMDTIGAESWIAHGTLIGYYWNEKILPWDSDIDVMISESSMDHLAQHYNMTVHSFQLPDSTASSSSSSSGSPGTTRDYMLEINSHYADPFMGDELNKIDGRWVDMTTGLYIDMTTARTRTRKAARTQTECDSTSDGQGQGQGDGDGDGDDDDTILVSKDGHSYAHADIFPLRRVQFEGVSACIPNAYDRILRAEYGDRALSETTFADHAFDLRTHEWLPMCDPDTMTDGITVSIVDGRRVVRGPGCGRIMEDLEVAEWVRQQGVMRGYRAGRHHAAGEGLESQDGRDGSC